jgi:hypothetical protein
VSEQSSFGRRQAPRPAMARPICDAPALSAEAEAFRAQLTASQPQPPEAGFAEWRRTQQAGRYFAWAIAFVLLCPGVLCFVFNAPNAVSGGLELTGIAVNYWLRRERRRHLKKITSWETPSGA